MLHLQACTNKVREKKRKFNFGLDYFEYYSTLNSIASKVLYHGSTTACTYNCKC